MSNSAPVRWATNKLIDMMDEGRISPRDVAEECLQYMSEGQVRDMATPTFFPDWDDEEEEEEEEEDEEDS